MRWKAHELAVTDPELLPDMLKLIAGLVGEDPGVCSDGDKLREERFPHEPPVRFTGVTAPGGLIGVGVRRVAPNNDDKDMDLSTTGVELAFLGVAGLNPRSVSPMASRHLCLSVTSIGESIK